MITNLYPINFSDFIYDAILWAHNGLIFCLALGYLIWDRCLRGMDPTPLDVLFHPGF